MEVWEWLQPWWNWWAGFTDLFDWEAIGAVATALAVCVALWATAFQERRVQRRIEAASDALHQGAVDTLRQGWIAIEEAAQSFTAAGDVQPGNLRKPAAKVERARRLMVLFVAREVDPRMLIGLLQMDDLLAEAENELSIAISRSQMGVLKNAPIYGRLRKAVHSAELLFISLA